MCDKSNGMINFAETKLTRSTRRIRHAAHNEKNTKVHNIFHNSSRYLHSKNNYKLLITITIINILINYF